MADVEEEVREVRTSNDVVDGAGVHRERVVRATSVSGGEAAARVAWYVIGVIVALLALRLVFQLLGANESNAFVNFVYGLSGVFAAPFFGIFSYQPSYGISYFEVSTFVAIIVYVLIGWALAKLFTLGSRSTAAV